MNQGTRHYHRQKPDGGANQHESSSFHKPSNLCEASPRENPTEQRTENKPGVGKAQVGQSRKQTRQRRHRASQAHATRRTRSQQTNKAVAAGKERAETSTNLPTVQDHRHIDSMSTKSGVFESITPEPPFVETECDSVTELLFEYQGCTLLHASRYQHKCQHREVFKIVNQQINRGLVHKKSLNIAFHRRLQQYICPRRLGSTSTTESNQQESSWERKTIVQKRQTPVRSE